MQPPTLTGTPNGSNTKKSVTLLQGECYVTDRRGLELTTLLGSCIATCMYDTTAGVGGMNHFLLPFGSADSPSTERYGLYAMEILINGLLKNGARRSRLSAKVFGGAQMGESINGIGDRNAAFAFSFLELERIPCLARSTGGTLARRIKFCPSTGRVSQLFVRDMVADAPQNPPQGDDVMFFDGDHS